jgi:aryl-alcohol dehydrogenase-like predicted oxidoreductase
MLSNSATAKATQAYAAAHPEISYRPLGDSGLLVSPAGFGGYRVDISFKTHFQALRHALRHGINLVDTSSKGGYLQGQNVERSQERKKAGRPFPDLVPYAQGLEHCIHPEFLEDQLTRSLARLGLEALDVYLLHNPEYYLSWAEKNGVPVAGARAEYERRIELAFRYLEEEVARGRIRTYGISANTFPAPATAANHTSLARVWEIAQEAAPDHHFRVVQWPMNLLESGAATEPNQPDGRSALAFARDHKLGVLVNRPLNAIDDNQLVRLAEVAPAGAAQPEQVPALLEALLQEEAHFRDAILPLLALESEAGEQVAEAFTAGRVLQWRWRGLGSYQNWNDLQTRYLVPRVQSAVHFLSNRPNLPAEASSWLHGYVKALNEAMRAVEAIYADEAARLASNIKKHVAAVDAEWGEADTLSQMALRALRSTAGVTSVLVGMRREEYVDDVLAELKRNVTVRERSDSWAALFK